MVAYCYAIILRIVVLTERKTISGDMTPLGSEASPWTARRSSRRRFFSVSGTALAAGVSRQGPAASAMPPTNCIRIDA